MKITKRMPRNFLIDKNNLIPHMDFDMGIDEVALKNFENKGLATKQKECGLNRGEVYLVTYIGRGSKIKSNFGESRNLKVISFNYISDKGVFYMIYTMLLQDVDTLEYISIDPSNDNYTFLKLKNKKAKNK